MASALTFIKDLFLTFSILFSMIFSPYAAETYEAKKPDDAKLVFNAVSDVHVETNNPSSYGNFEKILRGIKANKSSDAIVFLGDNTMNGQEIENLLFFSGVNALVDSDNTFIALGNHDIGNGNGDYNKFLSRYKRYNNLLLKNKINKPYYSRVVNSCYMIFLASDSLCVNTFYMSAEQIKWFGNTLAEAEKSENPIFVFAHHPLNRLENENNNLLSDILGNYDNIIYIHGHTHMPYAVYKQNGIVCVNLPRVTETVDYAAGTGVTVEVYDNEILLRERDFFKGEWLSETSVPIK